MTGTPWFYVFGGLRAATRRRACYVVLPDDVKPNYVGIKSGASVSNVIDRRNAELP